jgi:hypothetical protein
MISNLLTEEREALIRLYRNMTPEQRLVAFLNHSRFIQHLYRAGQSFRQPFRTRKNRVPRQSSK